MARLLRTLDGGVYMSEHQWKGSNCLPLKTVDEVRPREAGEQMGFPHSLLSHLFSAPLILSSNIS